MRIVKSDPEYSCESKSLSQEINLLSVSPCEVFLTNLPDQPLSRRDMLVEAKICPLRALSLGQVHILNFVSHVHVLIYVSIRWLTSLPSWCVWTPRSTLTSASSHPSVAAGQDVSRGRTPRRVVTPMMLVAAMKNKKCLLLILVETSARLCI